MIDWKPVGARIRKRREALSLTQRELGEKVGMVASTVAQHETGARATRDEKIALFAKALDVSEAWLRYGVIAMSAEDRAIIEREAFERGEKAATDRVWKALAKMGVTPSGESPLGRALGARDRKGGA